MKLYWRYKKDGKWTWTSASTLWARDEDGQMYKRVVEEEE